MFYDLTPCTNYDVIANLDNQISCAGGSDGDLSATALTPDTFFTYSNSYSWTDGSANVVGTTNSISGISAGTYTCVVTDAVNGCSATTSYVVTEPSPVVFTSVVTTSTTPTSNNGSVDISIGGGTPCATSLVVGSDSVASYESYLWYTYYMDGNTQITYPAAELAALGMNPGDVMDELGWKILTLGSGTVMNNAQMTVNGVVVYTGNYTPVAGMNNFVFSTPVTTQVAI